MIDWIIRFCKGIIIGSGFILPGVSGGALAAVFGVYERIISFLAHITCDFKKNVLYFIPLGFGGITGVFLLSFGVSTCDFKKNVLYFIPLGFGGITGVFLLSFGVSFLLEAYETQILWLFIGCILGTLPTLWNEAGKKGRQSKHILILVMSFFISLAFLYYGNNLFGGNVPQNFFTWIIAGALIGLGVIVPGLSPSNFLVYMGMYKDMADGIKDLDFMVIIPIAIGAICTVLLLSKIMDYIFRKLYAGLFHGILGIVLASTIMIVPFNYNYLSIGAFTCFALCAVGVALGFWMCSLEKKYKTA